MLRTLLGNSPRLHTQLVLVFVGLFALVQIVSLLVMDQRRARIALAHIEQELNVGEQIFERLLAQERGPLERAAIVIASDLGFRTAIANNNLNTVTSVLRNQGDRIQADLMQLVTVGGMILADSKGQRRAGEMFPLPHLLRLAEISGKATTTVVMPDGLAYQLVVVPIVGTRVVGWVAIGFQLNDKRAHDLRAAINLEVSFVRQATTGEWRLLASSLAPAHADAVVNLLNTTIAGNSPSARRSGNPGFAITLPDGEYESRLLIVDEEGSSKVAVLLHRSVEAALRPFAILAQAFFTIAGAGMALFVLGSIMVSRAIARPVDALAVFAQRIEEGDYNATVQVESAREIEILASSIDRMRSAVSEREDRIKRLAYHDPLTGLANRAHLLERLEQSIALSKQSRKPVSVLLMDLDRFKYINDVLGHQNGDIVLQEVATRLSSLLADPAIVARLGGDEFAVLLPQTSSAIAARIADRIAAALIAPITIEGQTVDIGASIGIATHPAHGSGAPALLRAADIAMYAAKRTGTGMMVFNEHHSLERQRHLSLLSDLRRAIEDNQLCLHFQPKIELLTGRVVGAEAMVRWDHPDRGVVLPSEFIPFLEQSGHVQSLTSWAIRTGIRQIADWARVGKPLILSINISARDLLNQDLPAFISDLLVEHEVTANQLCLELTESAFMEDPPSALATIRRLHRIGLSLAIDDYGTGYSSLAYIQRLPVHELKIDRSFVGTLVQSKDNRTIVRSTIELGHNLGLKVTAEGIENAGALHALRRMGCDTGQGYYFAHPMRHGDFDRWCASHHNFDEAKRELAAERANSQTSKMFG
jgi:diguanylate cyclase (GGDEF)-like protein